MSASLLSSSPPSTGSPPAIDPLTGVADRQALLAAINDQLHRVRVLDTEGAALLVLGLDRFKAINARLGYRAGDHVLIELARRLQGLAGPHDLVARLGSDELAVLFTGLPNVDEARQRAEAVRRKLRWPLLAKRRISLTASIGLAWLDPFYAQHDEVLRDAEIALARAKSRGHGQIELFDIEQHGNNISQLELESDLKDAIAKGELCLHYQPIIDLVTGRVRGFEALVRWQHLTRGMLRPRHFIGLADNAGLLPAICDWTIDTACRQLAAWRHEMPQAAAWTMSVNVDSSRLAEPSLAARIDHALESSGLKADDLILEITENAMMTTSDAAEALEQLEQRGIKLHIDDFGTGYATLSYLHRLSSRALKIDASFVTAMLDNSRKLEIVRSVVHLAHKLDLQVIAEGVETPHHLEALRALGCDFAQGFFFSRPLDADSLGVLLSSDVDWLEKD